ncbi:hypothetical protein DAPPUDRAFT_238275 [Daphnia pulex]|uniref:Uncharacterized protein n=1 Tax=Daphnia pulex TaxID=6669 RepID=E9G602_DAPPU|nr:hypothetical protein DAPPUDRAFT_238275 [Daphnia pulex]|eukprot:EFX85080.1 hypothetical protein DAPPUDRAFT_238275 [Daphnia pulex]
MKAKVLQGYKRLQQQNQKLFQQECQLTVDKMTFSVSLNSQRIGNSTGKLDCQLSAGLEPSQRPVGSSTANVADCLTSGFTSTPAIQEQEQHPTWCMHSPGSTEIKKKCGIAGTRSKQLTTIGRSFHLVYTTQFVRVSLKV